VDEDMPLPEAEAGNRSASRAHESAPPWDDEGDSTDGREHPAAGRPMSRADAVREAPATGHRAASPRGGAWADVDSDDASDFDRTDVSFDEGNPMAASSDDAPDDAAGDTRRASGARPSALVTAAAGRDSGSVSRAPGNATGRPAGLDTAAEALPRTELGQQWADTLQPLLQATGRRPGARAAAGDGESAVQPLLALVRELAVQGELVSVAPHPAGGRVWRLRVAREMLRQPALCDKLAAALGGLLGEPCRIETEAGAVGDTIARREAAARAARQRDAERRMHGDPSVRALLQAFPGAQLVPGSIRPVDPPAPGA
jgi:hypothetical protein